MRFVARVGSRIRSLRRYLFGGALLAVVLGCSACSPAEPVIPVYADPSIPIDVEQGRSFIIALADDPMNGLMWEAEYDVGVLQLQSDELVYPEDRDCTRCSWGYYQFTFEAVSEGESVVACTYRRPGFPADTDEVRTFTVNVAR